MSSISQIPKDLQLHCFQYLDIPDLGRASVVSKDFKELSSSAMFEEIESGLLADPDRITLFRKMNRIPLCLNDSLSSYAVFQKRFLRSLLQEKPSLASCRDLTKVTESVVADKKKALKDLFRWILRHDLNSFVERNEITPEDLVKSLIKFQPGYLDSFVDKAVDTREISRISSYLSEHSPLSAEAFNALKRDFGIDFENPETVKNLPGKLSDLAPADEIISLARACFRGKNLDFLERLSEGMEQEPTRLETFLEEAEAAESIGPVFQWFSPFSDEYGATFCPLTGIE